jgi:hypothetical protein
VDSVKSYRHYRVGEHPRFPIKNKEKRWRS